MHDLHDLMAPSIPSPLIHPGGLFTRNEKVNKLNVSFSCDCPVIDREIYNNIVKGTVDP